MSWSFSVPDGAAEHFEANAADAQASYLSGSPTLADEAKDQIAEAVEAAVTLVSAGVVGYGQVHATLTGHANPGHKPAPGWANDMVTISLSYIG